MLELKSIVKNYYVGEQTVKALKGVDICFRKSEFVSILGQSGCGKTTLLNIIGGLDRYTSGDMVVNGISTKFFTDADWDAYRNHSIGFVFQSYNLISHQTILANVELALTISGVSKEERRERAIEALKTVGLEDQIKKLPAQLSGGQMQRVAIARALVNNPEIILADEPTGALDTETSIQVMDILKEISKTKLVIMVTHNPELANVYSTRIINLKDGSVCNDSHPYACTATENVERYTESVEKIKGDNKKTKKPSMSLLTALSLSLNNLKTKKARTLLTSFAGSIGIIGIALILSLSTGFNTYIGKVQKDTLSNYPITISNSSMDMTSFLTAFMGITDDNSLEAYPDSDSLTSNPMIQSMMSAYSVSYGSNDLSSFKKYLESNPDLLDESKVSAVSYTYDFDMHLYQKQSENSYRKVNYIGPISNYMPNVDGGLTESMFSKYYQSFKNLMSTNNCWGEMIGSLDLIKSQYDLLEGSWPIMDGKTQNGKWPLVIVVDKYNRIPDYALYMMGILSDEDVQYIFTKMALELMDTMNGTNNAEQILNETFPDYKLESDYKFKDLVGINYNVLLNGEFFTETKSQEAYGHTLKTYGAMYGTSGTFLQNYSNLSASDSTIPQEYLNDLLSSLNDGIELEIVGVVRLKEGVSSGALGDNICYTPALTQALLAKTNEIPAVKAQNESCDIDLGNGNKGTWNVLTGGISTDSTLLATSYSLLGIADADTPTGISIYPTSFENKDYVISIIDNYNAMQKSEKEQIKYTDYIGQMMSSITEIINAVTYVLIAFVSISLIVSSIMIGVITYISVLERTKEIGILRAIGASKKDVARVFNAETIIIGFISGAMGILITLLLNVPISLIINALAGIPNVASLPVIGGIALVLISIALTLIAGIIPSSLASKKDPVIALRTE